MPACLPALLCAATSPGPAAPFGFPPFFFFNLNLILLPYCKFPPNSRAAVASGLCCCVVWTNFEKSLLTLCTSPRGQPRRSRGRDTQSSKKTLLQQEGGCSHVMSWPVKRAEKPVMDFQEQPLHPLCWCFPWVCPKQWPGRNSHCPASRTLTARWGRGTTAWGGCKLQHRGRLLGEL